MRPSKRLLILVAVAVAAAVLSGCLVPRPPGAAPLRYRDTVFSAVTVTSNLRYGSAVNTSGVNQALFLDLYQPTGDTRTSRPALVFVHGGGFSGGDKAAGVAPDMATEFTKRGYVTVSINYRLISGPCGGSNLGGACTAAALDAGHDAQAAVRWLRANAARYRIDPTRIGISGESAGGITAALVGMRGDDPGTSGNPGFSSRVSGWVSISGGLPNGVFASADDAPGLLFHGDADAIVPWQWSVDTTKALVGVGVPVFIQSLAGAGHVPYGTYRSRFIEQADYFFYWLLDVAHAQGQPPAAARAADARLARYATSAGPKRYVRRAERLRATHTQYVR
jgi:acetyl esterase/lipase